MDYALDCLGAVIRGRREAAGLTQAELGQQAGYGAGAGVSISRVEAGLTRPGPEKFAGIATALQLTPAQLEAEAALLTAQTGAESPRAEDSRERARDRAKRIQLEINRRTRTIESLGTKFNEAHDAARDNFLLPFIRVASTIDGAPLPDTTLLKDEEVDDGDAESVAAYRLRFTSFGVAKALAGGAGSVAAGGAAGAAAAYGTFAAAVTFGTASTGTAISSLSGVAATNAALALIGGGTLASGGAGIAGGTLVLSGIVAAPALLAAVGAVIWMVKRNKKHQQELQAQLDEVEDGLAANQRGYDALVDIMPRATDVLLYIEDRAGHELRRWEKRLPAEPRQWQDLGDAERQRYDDFVRITAAQLTVGTVEVEQLMIERGDEREQLIELADEILTQAMTTAEDIV